MVRLLLLPLQPYRRAKTSRKHQVRKASPRPFVGEQNPPQPHTSLWTEVNQSFQHKRNAWEPIYNDEQVVEAPSFLPTRRWVHVAVTLQGSTGRLYVDGSEMASSDAILLSPRQVGDQVDFLGRIRRSR